MAKGTIDEGPTFLQAREVLCQVVSSQLNQTTVLVHALSLGANPARERYIGCMMGENSQGHLHELDPAQELHAQKDQRADRRSGRSIPNVHVGMWGG